MFCSRFALPFSYRPSSPRVPVLLAAVLVWLFLSAASAQSPVPDGRTGVRVMLIVPITGGNSLDNPRRPALVPVPGLQAKANEIAGLIGFRYELSDDGRFALVELTARDRAVFQDLFQGRLGSHRVFEIGLTPPGEIEAAFAKHKRGFKLENFGRRGRP